MRSNHAHSAGAVDAQDMAGEGIYGPWSTSARRRI